VNTKPCNHRIRIPTITAIVLTAPTIITTGITPILITIILTTDTKIYLYHSYQERIIDKSYV
jgi:hypothetical protein